jgi:hypothetical protein
MKTRTWLLLLATAYALPTTAHAQKTTLTVSGYPIAFPAPTATDFTNGFITSTSALLFTVDATTGSPAQRTTTVSIRCSAPCPTTGTKTGLLWRRSDLGTWITLSTTDADVETRVVFKGSTNDPWSNSIYFQFALDWLADAPSATTNSYDIIMTLTVTIP